MKRRPKPYPWKNVSTTGRRRDVPVMPATNVKYPAIAPERFGDFYFRPIDADGPVPER